jgi:hypothetical protein
MDETLPSMENAPDAYTLSVQAAASVLRIPPEEVMRAMRAGLLPHILLRGNAAPEYRLHPEDVLDYLGRSVAVQGASAGNGFHHSNGAQSSTWHAGTQTAGGEPSAAEAQAASLVDAAVEALVRTLQERLIEPLVAMNARLAEENAQLQALMRAQTEALTAQQEEYARATVDIAAVPEMVAAVQARIDTVQSELQELERLHRQEIEVSYRAALQGLERRPWWMRFPNLG